MSRLRLHQPARYRLVVGTHVGGGETAIWPEGFMFEYGRSAAGAPHHHSGGHASRSGRLARHPYSE